MFNKPLFGKNFDMDRLFVTNFEDKEALYKSARDKEQVRSDPPREKACAVSDGGQPSSDIPD